MNTNEKKNDGGPAFPVNTEMLNGGLSPSSGMSLRDYFATKALQGMCSGEIWPSDADANRMAEKSYLFADAMLKAREQ